MDVDYRRISSLLLNPLRTICLYLSSGVNCVCGLIPLGDTRRVASSRENKAWERAPPGRQRSVGRLK